MLHRVRRAVWGRLLEDDARAVSRSPGELARFYGYDNSGLSGVRTNDIGKDDGDHVVCGQYPAPERPHCASRRQVNGTSRQPSLPTLVMLSAKIIILPSK